MTKRIIETGINQMTHPNPYVRSRLQEDSVSECQYGCKYYRDPQTDILVLSHNAAYGCKRTRGAIESEILTQFFKTSSHWMLPLKDRLEQETINILTFKAAVNVVEKQIPPLKGHFANLAEAATKAGETIKTFVTSQSAQ